MPELPDITVYIEALAERTLGQTLPRIRLNSPFLLRSVDPPLSACEGKAVHDYRRLGKRIAIRLDSDLWLVLHLMIPRRLHWKAPGVTLSNHRMLPPFHFPHLSLQPPPPHPDRPQ